MPRAPVPATRVPAVSPELYRKITSLTLAALVAIIVTGGAVRLTGSGLGCPSWPSCTATRLVAPDRFHPRVEFFNRVFTGLVSVSIAFAALGAVLRRPRRRDLEWLAGGLVVGLIAQIVLGGLTVKHRLEPGFVMAHFLLSMLLVWDGVVLHERAARDGPDRASGSAWRWIGRLLAVEAAMTVVIGTVVTGAGPHSGANAGDGRVARWHLDLHRVTQLHGTSAMLLLITAGVVWWRLRGVPGMPWDRAQHLLEALAIQVTIGYTQYFMGIPVFLVAFHILGAALVWVAALRLAVALGRDPARAPTLLVPA